MPSSTFQPRPSARRIRSQRTEQRLKIIVLRPNLLFPRDSGEKAHSGQLLRELSRIHDVTLVTCRLPEDRDDDVAQTAKLCKHLITVPFKPKSPGLLRRLTPHTSAAWGSRCENCAMEMARTMSGTVAGLYATHRPDVLVCDSVFACDALRYLPEAPYVLFEHNIESQLLQHRADRASSLLQSAMFHWRSWKLRRYEQNKCRRARFVIASSDADCHVLREEFGAQHCETVLPAVDTTYYTPAISAPRANNLVFTGAMDWPVNQEAVDYFVRDIFPLIQRETPNVMFSIVGRNAPAKIQELGKLRGINVTNTVNDIRPFVHGAKVYVAPLRHDGGTRLNLLEALAMGKAIVSTTSAAEGLHAEHGRNILLADTPETFSREVVSLLRDNERRAMLESNARSLAERSHTWKHAAQKFANVCANASR